MKNSRKLLLVYSFILLVTIGLVAPTAVSYTNAANVAEAQANICAQVVAKAFQNLDNRCNKLGRNKLCFANSSLQLQAQQGATGLVFERPGDTIDVKNVRSLKLAGFDAAAGTWGVAQFRLQADLPDTPLDQNVTMILFGDAEVTEASLPVSNLLATTVLATRTAAAPTISAADTSIAPTEQLRNTQIAAQDRAFNTQVYSTRNAQTTQTRAAISGTNTAQAGATQARATVEGATLQAFLNTQNKTAQARNTAQSGTAQAKNTAQAATLWAQSTSQDATQWAQNTLDAESRASQGTIQASTSQARDTKVYNTIAAPLPVPTYRNMQAFYLRTGAGPAPCAEAPRSGVLIQVPASQQIIRFSINEATIDLASTAFLVAEPNGMFFIYTLDGSTGVTAFGVTQAALAGMVIRIPLDASLKVSGPPQAAVAYDATALKRLPLKSLPKDIKLVSPRDTLGTGSLVSGELGEACVAGGVTGQNATIDSTVLALPVGKAWKATAGTTATFTVKGDLLIQGLWKNYIALAPAGAGYAKPVEASAFAVSGGSTSLTYTFTKDIPEFYVDVGVAPPGGVILSVTCQAAPTAQPSATATNSPTKTSSPTRTPRQSATASDTPVPSDSPTSTSSNTATVTDTATYTASPTNTNTATASPTITRLPSDTATVTPSSTGLQIMDKPTIAP